MKRNRAKIARRAIRDRKIGRRSKTEMAAGFIRVFISRRLFTSECETRHKERVMFEMEGDDAPRLFIRVNRAER